jgi:hypothetical protein
MGTRANDAANEVEALFREILPQSCRTKLVKSTAKAKKRRAK